jgi:hypothetical protein
MAGRDALQLCPQILTAGGRIRHEPFLVQNREHRESGGGSHGIAAESREEAELGLKGLDHGPVGDDHAHWVAVAHGLAEGHHVGFEAAALESPEMRTGAAQSILHLIGNDQAAHRARARRDRRGPGSGRIENAAAGDRGIDEKRRRSQSSPLKRTDRPIGVLRHRGQFCGAALIEGAQSRRRRRDRYDPRVAGLCGPRRESRGAFGNTVIGMLHDQCAAVTRGHLRHAPGHIVGLAAGIDENAGIEMRRQAGRELIRIVQDVLMEVAGVSRKESRLPLNRSDHRGVGMPDVRHVVVDIQVRPPLGVVQPDSRSAHQVQRLFIKQFGAGAHQPMTPREKGRGCRCGGSGGSRRCARPCDCSGGSRRRVPCTG